jgi:gas vesicle protein
MSEDRGYLGTNLMFFLMGAAVGAVVVALTTPKNGPDLRADLAELSKRLKQKAQEASRALRSGCCEEKAEEEPPEAAG